MALERHMKNKGHVSEVRKANKSSGRKVDEINKKAVEVKVQKEYICPICAKIFRNRTNLSQHEKTHRILKPSK